MEKYKVNFTTKWADFDANMHMRHTAYNDYAAEVRLRYFQEFGWTMQKLVRLGIGPILFKEETSFLKEIHIGTDISVTIELEAASKNFERWKFKHYIFNHKGEVSAEVLVLGAWIDLKKRKLTKPPQEVFDFCNKMTKSLHFEEIPLKNN